MNKEQEKSIVDATEPLVGSGSFLQAEQNRKRKAEQEADRRPEAVPMGGDKKRAALEFEARVAQLAQPSKQ